MRTARRRLAALLTTLVVGGGVLAGAPAGAADGTSYSSVGTALSQVAAAGLPTTLTLTAEPAAVPYGGTTTLTGRLTHPGTGSAVAGAPVRLETRSADGSWVERELLVTDGSGSVTTVQTPRASTTYRLRHGEPGTTEESVSQEAPVTVSAGVIATSSTHAVRLGRAVSVTGSVGPPQAGVLIRLERRASDGWTKLGATRTGTDGTFAFRVSPTSPGFWSMRVVRVGSGMTAVLPAVDVFRLHRYSVVKRGVVRADMGEFRREVAAVYADERGWARAHHRFRPVTRSHARGELTVVLSQARYLPAFSSQCSTMYSCRVGRYVILNQDRWLNGSPYFPGTLEQYRRMLVNHETGHWLGRGHAYCSGRGKLAPVMQQQSKGMHGCRVNPWPLPREIRAVS